MMYRKQVNERKAAKTFRRTAKRTKVANMQKAPHRGGWRL